jgi:hypothetical protein
VSKKLARVIGAVSACLPPDLPVLLVTPVEMRQWLNIQGRMNKEQLRSFAILSGAPLTWPQDAHDAHVVALAALARLEHETGRNAA